LVTWFVIDGVISAAIKYNALVGTQGATKKPLDSVTGVIAAGFVAWAVLVIGIKIAMP
jgi:hypothetical protein